MSAAAPRATKGRAVLATIDQGLNGLASFILVVGVARVAPSETLAHFLLANLAFQILLGLFRASITQPFMVHRATTGIDTRSSERQFLSATAWAALGVTLAALAVTLPMGGEARSITQVLTLTFPFLALGDGLRYIAIARSQPGRAVVIDGTRVLLFVAPLGAWTVAGDPTPFGVIWLRFGAVAAAAALAVVVARAWVPRPAIVRWWRENRSMSLAFGAENVLTRVSAYSVTYGLVWFAPLAALAGFRAGSSLTNLISVMFASVPMVLLPHYRSQLTAATQVISRAELMRMASTVSGAVVGITLVGSVVLLNLPASVGEQMFGESWDVTLDSLPGLLFWTAGGGATLGPQMVLRSTARTREGVVARTVQCTAIVVLGFAGAALGGAPGAAWGLGLGSWVGVVAWFRLVWADGAWDPRSDAIATRAAAGSDGRDGDEDGALVGS